MNGFILIMLGLGLLCFVLAAVNYKPLGDKLVLAALGLAFWILTEFVPRLDAWLE